MSVITIRENASLKLYSTMRLGGTARFMCEVTSEDEVQEAVHFAKQHHLSCRVIGIGSNIIWKDSGYDGLLIVNKIIGHKLHDDGTTVTFGAGLSWDVAVNFAVTHHLSGIEFLSLIPGTVGATPVQNVGAYGAEIKDTLISLKAYDMKLAKFVELTNYECGFTYRGSKFKSADSGRFIITSITLSLSHNNPQPPFYDSLQTYLDTHDTTEYTPGSIRQAVIAIRSAKLPDPSKIANNGSFFANPVINHAHYKKLQAEFTGIKGWVQKDGSVKIAAGWLIEQAGFSDYHDTQTGMATWHAQSLVLVNEHARSTNDLLVFKQKIVVAVQDKFGIDLVQEPELLP